MSAMTTITGAWSSDANGWVSEMLTLTGDIWIEVTLPSKGRLVIKKSESADGPWPKAMITPWTGPDFKIRIRHGVDTMTGDTPKSRYIKIITTETPISIKYANI